MFSRLVLRAARVTPTSAVGRPLALARPSITPVFQALSARSYAAGGPDVSASYKNVEARILDIFRTFDKVNQDNVSPPVAMARAATLSLLRPARRRPPLDLARLSSLSSGSSVLTPCCTLRPSLPPRPPSRRTSASTPSTLSRSLWRSRRSSWLRWVGACPRRSSLPLQGEGNNSSPFQQSHARSCLFQIPDAEADEIKTVKDGSSRDSLLASIQLSLKLTDHYLCLQPLTTSSLSVLSIILHGLPVGLLLTLTMWSFTLPLLQCPEGLSLSCHAVSPLPVSQAYYCISLRSSRTPLNMFSPPIRRELVGSRGYFGASI